MCLFKFSFVLGMLFLLPVPDLRTVDGTTGTSLTRACAVQKTHT